MCTGNVRCGSCRVNGFCLVFRENAVSRCGDDRYGATPDSPQRHRGHGEGRAEGMDERPPRWAKGAARGESGERGAGGTAPCNPRRREAGASAALHQGSRCAGASIPVVSFGRDALAPPPATFVQGFALLKEASLNCAAAIWFRVPVKNAVVHTRAGCSAARVLSVFSVGHRKSRSRLFESFQCPRRGFANPEHA